MPIKAERPYRCGTLVGWLHHCPLIIVLCWPVILPSMRVVMIHFLVIELECGWLVCMAWGLGSSVASWLSWSGCVYHCGLISWWLHVNGAICVLGTVGVVCWFIRFVSGVCCTCCPCCSGWASADFITGSQIIFACASEKILQFRSLFTVIYPYWRWLDFIGLVGCLFPDHEVFVRICWFLLVVWDQSFHSCCRACRSICHSRLTMRASKTGSNPSGMSLARAWIRDSHWNFLIIEFLCQVVSRFFVDDCLGKLFGSRLWRPRNDILLPIIPCSWRLIQID